MPDAGARLRTLSRVQIERHIADFLGIGADVEGEYWGEEHLLLDLPEKWRLSFAAWKDERPVAYAVLSRKGHGHIHLHHFMVARGWRGRGLGRRMVEEMETRARSLGGEMLSLKVASDNPRARRFYERSGFHECGADGNYIVFEKRLAARGDAPPRPAVVAIHQPNYLPWLGYFAKIAAADVFVFLDDVQFSKNSYINRVRILGGGGARWLTVPVSYRFGDPIARVRPARADWRSSHLDTLRTFYADAPAFASVFAWMERVFAGLPDGGLAAINRALIEAAASELGLSCRFVASSGIETGDAAGDDRLVRLVHAVAPDGTYLSGRGGAKYQNPEKFAAAGLGFRYADFAHPTYEQKGHAFVAGLSVLDAAFRMGWNGVAGLLAHARHASRDAPCPAP